MTINAAQIATIQTAVATALSDAKAPGDSSTATLQATLTTATSEAAALVPTPTPPVNTVPSAPVVVLSGSVISWTIPTATPVVAGIDVYVGGQKALYSQWSTGTVPTSLDLSKAPSTTTWGGTLPIPAAGASESVQITAYNSVGESVLSKVVTYTNGTVTPPPPPPPPPPPSGKILLGSYSTGQGQWSGTTAFANETGCTVSIRTDYAARTQSTFINDLTYVLGLDAGMPFNLALGVPIVDDGYPPVWSNYTAWIPLHKQAIPLIKAKFPNAFIRLGIELNIGTTTDFVPNPSGFVTAFNAIAPLYRAAGFRVEFNTVPQTGYNVTGVAQQCISNIDIISCDPYDQSYATPLPNNTPAESSTVWQSLVGGTDGLNALAAFARANGKGMAFAEWGVGAKSGGYGLGDDPTYIANIAAFITANADLFAKGYVSYFDNNPSGWDTRLSSSPNALAEFKKVFPAIVG